MLYFIKEYYRQGHFFRTDRFITDNQNLWFDWANADGTSYERYKGERWYYRYNIFGDKDSKCG